MKVKKFLCSFLALVMVLAVFPATVAQAAPSASGTEICERARQYIGKVPYVWGGKTIDGSNPGADCSGFVCRIYEKFGFNFWKHRTCIYKEGTNLGTDVSVAKPGDLIWFKGHISIFSGRNSKGDPMIIHETGGSFQNVVETKVSVVNAPIKGVIRIPGVLQDGESVYVPKIVFAKPVDPDYKNKIKVSDHNATVCLQITKPGGTTVKTMGMMLYDENMNLLKRHSEAVKVSSGSGSYHSWYDINKELGITLSPGTTYQYQMFGVFNGEEVQSDVYSFTTSGTAANQVPSVSFSTPTDPKYRGKIQVSDHNATVCLQITKPGGTSVKTMGMLLYDASLNLLKRHSETVKVGSGSGSYHSWYDINQELGVTLDPGTTYYYQMFGVFNGQEVQSDVYAFTTTGKAPREVHVISLISPNGDNMVSESLMEVEVGKPYGTLPDPDYIPDHTEFVGWFTKDMGGEQVLPDTIFQEHTDLTLYPRFQEKEPENRVILLTIGDPLIRIDGEPQEISVTGTTPVIYNNRTLLPVRAVIEAMGGSVKWNGDTRTVTMICGDKTLFLQIDNNTAWSGDGSTYLLDTAPIIMNSSTMLPIRFVAEYFNGIVGWDGDTRTVSITFSTNP